MEILVNGKEYKLNFGMGFIRNINKEAGVMTEIGNIGNGIMKTLPSLVGGDLEAIALYLKCATKGLSQNAIDDFLETKAGEGAEAFEAFYDELVKAVEEGTVTRVPFAKMKKTMEENK